ncbi:unnamed protein product [Closterium sp. NIES-64]|nr:unnamed protein product [Closterium sp. NIES-64]
MRRHNHPEATCFKKRDYEWYDVHGVSTNKRPPNWAPPRRVNHVEAVEVPSPSVDSTPSDIRLNLLFSGAGLINEKGSQYISSTQSPSLPPSSATPPPSPLASPLPSPFLSTYQRRHPAPPPPPAPTPDPDPVSTLPPTPTSLPLRLLRPRLPQPSLLAHRSRTPPQPFSLSVCVSLNPPPVGGDYSLMPSLLEDRHEEFIDIDSASTHSASSFQTSQSLTLNFSDNPSIPTTLTYAEAVSGPHAAQWLVAIVAEWSIDFHPSTSDPSLFIRATPSRFFILVYVDDMILVTKDQTELAAVKTALGEKLAMKDLGKLTNYLGMEITRDRTARTITLSQKFYINNVLTRFQMQEAASMPTPLSMQHQLTAPSVPSPESCDEPYPELVGSLMYVMMCTRPDLAYPVSVLSRYVAPGRFTRHHWSAAKRVLRYLKGTLDSVLTLAALPRFALGGIVTHPMLMTRVIGARPKGIASPLAVGL